MSFIVCRLLLGDFFWLVIVPCLMSVVVFCLSVVFVFFCGLLFVFVDCCCFGVRCSLLVVCCFVLIMLRVCCLLFVANCLFVMLLDVRCLLALGCCLLRFTYCLWVVV